MMSMVCSFQVFAKAAVFAAQISCLRSMDGPDGPVPSQTLGKETEIQPTFSAQNLFIQRRVERRRRFQRKILPHGALDKRLPERRIVEVERGSSPDRVFQIVRRIGNERKAVAAAVLLVIGPDAVIKPPVSRTSGSVPYFMAMSCVSPQGSKRRFDRRSEPA